MNEDQNSQKVGQNFSTKTLNICEGGDGDGLDQKPESSWRTDPISQEGQEEGERQALPY